jgi:hypothetical protein
VINLEHLAEEVQVALRKARRAARATPDDGSMSADLVHVPVGRAFPITRRTAAVRAVLEAAGYVTERESGIWRGYMIDPSLGRASSQLAACVAMAEELKSCRATVYYQRD